MVGREGNCCVGGKEFIYLTGAGMLRGKEGGKKPRVLTERVYLPMILEVAGVLRWRDENEYSWVWIVTNSCS